MKIAVLLLCHEAPAVLGAYLASPFFRHPDVKVWLHHDARQGDAALAAVRAVVPEGVACEVLADRVAVAWGEYSIVEATRRLMAAALADEAFGAQRLLLASASCHPIRPVSSLQRFLAERPGIEFIQAHDIARGRWVDDGLEEERFRWYFPFNFATQRRLFEFATRWQRRLRVRRQVPAGLRIHFGSQWFCLTRETAAAVVTALARPELARFFGRSWIPDEFAIQTLVACTCLPSQIANHGLTYYEFDRGGRPLVLEDDHAAHVLSQPFFFARKVAPDAARLRAALHAHCASDEADLSWFARAGQPTADYQRFLLRAEIDPAARASVGSFLPEEGGAMAANRRRYYVLHGTSRGYVAALARHARDGGRLPVFDFPFDRTGPGLAAERHTFRGFRPEDRHRARYDPRAFLRELVAIDADADGDADAAAGGGAGSGADAGRRAGPPVAFAIDPAVDSPLVELLSRDPRAVIVDCDPPGLDRARRAAAAVRHVQARHETGFLGPMLQALRDGAPLPQDRWREPGSHVKGGATHLALADLSLHADDATALALARAADALPAHRWYPARADAELLVGRAIAPKL